MNKFLLPAAAVLAATPGLQAQLPVVVAPETYRSALAVSPPQDGVTISGNFDGNFVADAVSLVSGALFFTHDLAFDRSVVALGYAANDLARRVVSGKQDEFVTVGAGGLLVGRWDNVATYTGSNDDGLVQQTLTTATAWTTATRVVCGDFDGDGDHDIAALAAGGSSVLTAFASPSGYAFSSVTLANTASHIAPLPKPSSEGHLLACAGSAGVKAVDLTTGSAQALAVPTGSYRSLAGSWFGGTSWVAALCASVTLPNSTVSQSLHVVSWTGTVVTLEIGPLDAAAIAFGDADGEGLPDLFVNSRTFGELAVFFNRDSATAPYSTNDPTSIFIITPADGLGDPDSGRDATIALFDHDRDGDDDLAFTDAPTGSVTVMRNPLLEDSQHTGFSPDVPWMEGYGEFVYPVVESQTTVGMEVTLAVATSDEVDLTAIEVAIWEEDEQGVVDPDACWTSIHDVSSASQHDHLLTVTLPETNLPFSAPYHIRVRMVTVNGSGEITFAGPAGFFRSTFAAARFLPPFQPDSTPISSGGVNPRPGGGGYGGPSTP